MNGGQTLFTRLEVPIVMTLGVAIMVAASVRLREPLQTADIATEASNIIQISIGLRPLKDAGAGYAALDNALALNYKAIPSNMVQGFGDKIDNSWGGKVTVAPAGESAGHFAITYTQVPPEACRQLSLKLRDMGWNSIRVGDKAIASDASPSEVAGDCADATNTLTFVSSEGM